MPTKNRRDFVTQAIKYFMQQDYPNKELIIVDDGHDKVQDLVPPDDGIHYVETTMGLSIGELRNRAIAESQGKIIAHWDDDDWYGGTRISYQVKPLLNGEADLTGLKVRVVYDLLDNQFWILESWLHAQIMELEIHGATMVYRRNLWEKTKFPSINFREDASFVSEVFRSGAKVLDMPNHENFIYVRHRNNTWRFACGEYGNPNGWRRIKPPKFLQSGDLTFYESIIKR
jgi:glycosyltransferase involved in cell wall biosynthesis